MELVIFKLRYLLNLAEATKPLNLTPTNYKFEILFAMFMVCVTIDIIEKQTINFDRLPKHCKVVPTTLTSLTEMKLTLFQFL